MIGPPVAAFLTTACDSWAVWGCQGSGAGALTFPLQVVETSGHCSPWQRWLEPPSLDGGSAAAALASVPDSAGDHQGGGS